MSFFSPSLAEGDVDEIILYSTLLQATRGARDPNLQVVITHASHVCNQHLFGIPLRMNGMHATQFDHARQFGPSITRNLIMRILTICYMKLTQSRAMEQNCFDLRSLSLSLLDLWLLLVLNLNFLSI